MQGFRRRLTYANVMATLALLVALGGTASAAVIISTNHQVGQHTISGHNPPAGDHANIIARSVDGADLATAAVGTQKIAPGTVGAGRLKNGAVTHAKLRPDAVAGDNVLDGSLTGDDLATGAVDSTKVADGSLTGSDVANRGLSDFDIGSPAQVSNADIGSIPANSCLPLQLNFGSWTEVGELVFVSARDGQLGSGGLFFTPLVVTTPGAATGRVCNVSTSANDPAPEDILAWSVRQ